MLVAIFLVTDKPTRGDVGTGDAFGLCPQVIRPSLLNFTNSRQTQTQERKQRKTNIVRNAISYIQKYSLVPKENVRIIIMAGLSTVKS